MTGDAHRPPAAARRLPLSVLGKPTGAACNLDCTYCFFLSKELLYDHDSQRMSATTLEAYLSNLLESQPDGPVEIAWQGGEPTMRGLAFFREAVRLAEELRRPRQIVTHTMQTNGTLLDDAWGAFLAEHGFLVGISIDGPRDVHDHHRTNKAGRGSHADVLRGWGVLQRHGVESNVLCTVHAANQDRGVEVYRYLRDQLGARHIQFIPIVERVPEEHLATAERGWRTAAGERLLYRQQGAAVTSRSVEPAAWGRFLSDVFDEWITSDVGEVYVQHFDVTLGNRLGRHSLCVHSPECGTAVAVEHNGDVYSCDHYVEPGHLLGNVADESIATMVDSEPQREFGRAKRASLPGKCVECPVRWACHGGCPKDRFATTEDGEPGLNHLCDGYLAFFSHAEPAITRMGEMLVRGEAVPRIMADPELGTLIGASRGTQVTNR